MVWLVWRGMHVRRAPMQVCHATIAADTPVRAAAQNPPFSPSGLQVLLLIIICIEGRARALLAFIRSTALCCDSMLRQAL